MLDSLFPQLTNENHTVTSPADVKYNCIAWAAGETSPWWDPYPAPEYFWPEGIPTDYSVDSLIQLYSSLGFSICESSGVETDFEKLAVYGDEAGYTHAARQLPNGKWTSKLGSLEDIEHATPELLEGEEYGSIVCHMKRETRSSI